MTRRLPLLGAGLGLGLALVLAVLAYGLRHQEQEPAAVVDGPTVAGEPAPPERPLARIEPFAAPAVEGRAVDGAAPVSLAGLAGRPVVVNLWASWCRPCRAEAPVLRTFAERHPDVALLGVANEGPEPAARFAREAGWSWPSVADPAQELMRRFRAPGLPATFFVDRRGRVVARVLGQVTAAQLEQGAAALGASRPS